MKFIDKYDVKSIKDIEENYQVLTTSTSAQINPDATLAQNDVTISNTNIK